MRKFLIIILLFVFVSCNKETITIPHNLEIKVSFENLQGGEIIEEAKLDCSEIPRGDGEGNIIRWDKPSSPDTWCGVKALNVPLKIDTLEKTLFFNIDPAPKDVELDVGLSPLYDSPMLYLKINGKEHVMMVENITKNIWHRDVDL